MANDFTRMAKRVKKLPSRMEEALDEEIGNEMEEMALTAIEIHTSRSRATGTLSMRIRAKRDPTQAHSPSLLTHVVVAEEDYAKFVEYGTGFRGEGRFKAPSSRPPIENILKWIVAAGIQPYAFDSRYELAFAIADVIEAYGTRPAPFMRPAWTQHRPQLSHRGRRAIKKSVRRL